jgi:hypothetical protein
MNNNTLYRKTKSLHVTVILLSLVCWSTQIPYIFCLIQPLPSAQLQSQTCIVQHHQGQYSRKKCMYTNTYHFHKSTVSTTKLYSSKSGNSQRTNVMIANKSPDTRLIINDSNPNEDNNKSNRQQQQEESTNAIITSEEVKRRTMKQLERLQLKDRMSPKLDKEVCLYNLNYTYIYIYSKDIILSFSNVELIFFCIFILSRIIYF